MKYAFIGGDSKTKFEPLVFVLDNGKFEIICESFERQKSYYEYLASRKYNNFDDLLATFSYMNVETGEVTPEVESMLNKLRARFAISQVADEELNTENQQNPEEDRQQNALLRISKRMRTGANER
jgi:hypothetical protein